MAVFFLLTKMVDKNYLQYLIFHRNKLIDRVPIGDRISAIGGTLGNL